MTYAAIVQHIADAANAWLPDDYHLGYAIVDIDQPQQSRALTDAELKREWRTRLAKYAARNDPGASADLAALPADDDGTGGHLLVEILHLPTGIRAVRCYTYAQVLNIINDPNRTNQQKRAAIRTALGNLYQTCQDRVAAAG